MKSNAIHKNGQRNFINGTIELDYKKAFELINERPLHLVTKSRRGNLTFYLCANVDGVRFIQTWNANDDVTKINDRMNTYANDDEFIRAIKRMVRRYNHYQGTFDEFKQMQTIVKSTIES